jgi:hypothetical protein
LVSRAFDHLDESGSTVGSGGDVEEDQLVCTLRIVSHGQLDGISDVAQFSRFGFPELNAARDLPGMDIKTWNDAAREHGKNEKRSMNRLANYRPVDLGLPARSPDECGSRHAAGHSLSFFVLQ